MLGEDDLMVRLLALDIDGTLVGADSTVSAPTRSALARAADAGCEMVLITGRSRMAAVPIADQMPEGALAGLATYDGAYVEALPNGPVLQDERMAPEAAREAVECMARYGLGPIVFPAGGDGSRVYAWDDHLPPAGWLDLNPGRAVAVGSDAIAEELRRGVVTISALGTLETATACAEDMRASLDHSASVIVTYSERYGGHFAQVAGPRGTKAVALDLLAAHLGTPMENVMAIGDWVNDVGMLRAAGIGVAMGDAPREVREAAAWVTGSVAEDGVAAAIERFVLGAS